MIRRLTWALVVLAALATTAACGGAQGREPSAPKVIVLGFDGLDYDLTRKLVNEGRMPHFQRLAESGTFRPLETSVPPQSPVAWSEFITGRDPGGHGIFDFIHRDAATLVPYLSTSRTHESDRFLKFGRYQIPLSGGRIELLRQGTAFWETLEARGIETTIMRMPANYPPSGAATRELSGMGTPDILGTYGTFSFFTSEPSRYAGREISGGKVYGVLPRDHHVRAALRGPDNPFLQEREKLILEFDVYLDPDAPAALFQVDGQEFLLQEGEWSDWVPVSFPMVPTQSLPGMCRFYLRQVRPVFELYVTPINIDPEDPAQPISTPDDFAARLAEATGRFYTQGMPEDTKALSSGVFSRDDFLAQARIAEAEVERQFPYVLREASGDLLFYYFGNVDQVSHMLWGTMDPDHPAYDAERDAPYADVIPSLYEKMDAITGEALKHAGPDTTLIVMSDHGFTSWRRAFHLNSWLWKEGYLEVRNPSMRNDPGFFANVDWSRTRAYGLGLNGLYVNLRGREKHGIVDPRDRDALLNEISERLLAVVDPETGRPAVTRVYRTDTYYKDREHLDVGPDLIVGYAKGTRCSNESALGAVPRDVFADNLDAWSGDHCMDHTTVPGILLSNRPLDPSVRSLRDLSREVLKLFGVTPEGS